MEREMVRRCSNYDSVYYYPHMAYPNMYTQYGYIRQGQCFDVISGVKVCATLQIPDKVMVDLQILGQSLMKRTLDLQNREVSLTAGAGGLSATVSARLTDTTRMCVYLYGQGCAPFAGCKSSDTTLCLR